MVMHARKPQRINDGYFEKHQTHPYQNSKYSSSKSNYNSNDRYDNRIRDSPNGNSYRSDNSPDSQSPRDRDRERDRHLYNSGKSSSSYLQKIREKERENRDYKISCDKYSDCSRSPKDKRSRDSEHRTNHDRSTDSKATNDSVKNSSHNSSRDRKPVHNCQEKREERERVPRVGDWTEHISSSGKKYYYNCKTEVSQWEKPREWLEKERERDSKYRSRDKDRDRDSDRSYRSGHDKHSSSGRPSSSSKTDSGRSSRHWSSRDEVSDHSDRRKYSSEESQTLAQDMDISPGDSTPTSSERDQLQQQQQQHQQQQQQSNAAATATVLDPVMLHSQLVPPPMMVLPPGATPLPMRLPSQTTPATPITPHPQSSPNAPGPPGTPLGTQLPRLLSTHGQPLPVIPDLASQSCGSQVSMQPLKVETNHTNTGVVEGPPTPTHSEHQDSLDPRKRTSTDHHTVHVSPPPASSLPTGLQGVSSSLSALRPQGPTITPSLANHYRDDLVNHVRGWPADILEKQAQKLAEEAHILGSLQCTKVSAELKSARSIVRLTEIQATLHEQRILFLRQQIKALEEMKSQNSFMSDDS